jgi:hypothetical protein
MRMRMMRIRMRMREEVNRLKTVRPLQEILTIQVMIMMTMMMMMMMMMMMRSFLHLLLCTRAVRVGDVR